MIRLQHREPISPALRRNASTHKLALSIAFARTAVIFGQLTKVAKRNSIQLRRAPTYTLRKTTYDHKCSQSPYS